VTVGGRSRPSLPEASDRGGYDDDDDSGQCRVVSPGSIARRQSPRHGAHPDPPPRAAAASVHGRPSRSAAVSRVAHRHTTRSSSHYADFLIPTRNHDFYRRTSGKSAADHGVLFPSLDVPQKQDVVVSRTCVYSCSLLPFFVFSFYRSGLYVSSRTGCAGRDHLFVCFTLVGYIDIVRTYSVFAFFNSRVAVLRKTLNKHVKSYRLIHLAHDRYLLN